jgi:hypothetical protein
VNRPHDAQAHANDQIKQAQEVVKSLLSQTLRTDTAMPERPVLLHDLHKIQGHLSRAIQVLNENAASQPRA